MTLNFIRLYRFGSTGNLVLRWPMMDLNREIITADRISWSGRTYFSIHGPLTDAKKFRMFFLFRHLFQIVANASNGNNSTSTNPVGNQPKTHSPSKWFLFHFSIILHLHLTFKLDDLLVTIRWLIRDESLDLPWFGCKGLQNKIIPHIF